jgi:hypothetical protein
MKRSSIALIISLVTFAGAARAEAEEPSPPSSDASRFGSKHSLVISGDFSLAVQRYAWTPGPTDTSITVRPRLDYFVLDHLSVGGSVEFGYTVGTSYSVTSQHTVSIGPRIGYEIPLGDRISLWPNLGLSSRTWMMTVDPWPSGAYWTLNAVASADLVAPLAPHFFMGLGPYLTRQIAGSGSTSPGTGYGVVSTIGGWI